MLSFLIFGVKSIAHQTLNLPAHAPVMVLPEATLFPNALLPLHIFEPRYRAMLAWALEHHRMFCVALLKPGVQADDSNDAFHHTAGLGLVRACVQRGDGTSDLVLQGLARVRFTGFLEEKPFRIAELRELRSRAAPELQGEALAAKLIELCLELRVDAKVLPEQLEQQLAKMNNPEMLGDVIAHTFLRDSRKRQELLEELEVGDRLRSLIAHLQEQIA